MRVFLILFLLGVSTFGQIIGPKIFFPNETYDFGKIMQGDTAVHRFSFVNKGDDTLKILSVMTSCGCTVVDLPKKDLLPNEIIQLKVEFNSMGKTGNQEKYISVSSNDKDRPLVRLLLTGVVAPELSEAAKNLPLPKLEFTEEKFDFGAVKEGAILVHIFEIKNSGTQDLEIRNITTSCGCTAAMASSKLLKPGEKGTLKVEFDTTNKNGKLTRVITLTTNEPQNSVKTISVLADITKKDS